MEIYLVHLIQFRRPKVQCQVTYWPGLEATSALSHQSGLHTQGKEILGQRFALSKQLLWEATLGSHL